MAKIGYARVSSKEQHLDRQLAALKDVDKLFTDELSNFLKNTNDYFLIKVKYSYFDIFCLSLCIIMINKLE